MSFDIDCVVIGAGVVGIAVARALALAGRDVVVVDTESTIGTGISSRNSGVIHAGIYYPPDSLKARHCVGGREMLYAYCERHGVPHRRLGKLVVAHDKGELPALEAIAQRAHDNGVDDLTVLSRSQIHTMEPELAAHAALHSPSAGIVDTHSLMLALKGDAEDHGAVFAFQTPVVGGAVEAGSVMVATAGRDPASLRARFVVNAAGLNAADVAARFDGLAAAAPHMKMAKGNYFGVRGRVPFSRLVYPVPEAGGLGVHLTLDMAGQGRFGPDVEWIDNIDYAVDGKRAARFYDAIRRFWPALKDGSLYPDYSGIRPKIKGQAAPDFFIDDRNENLICLYGIESPGLTSCLSIAEDVSGIIEHRSR